ncbi:hypothetical protein L3Q82_006510 [Scortum barcoo]|uniref:Uncharacterized protein n=1 Tax=Scortum barcoo TaxID=214431 RepID=A0ACB8X0A4_9TELE|nr:hypothetical protein L3Q82_006510 [Scortum barcoo]
MDRISRCSQGPEGVWFGNHRISSLLFADDVVLLASSGQDLQHVLGRFAAECEAARDENQQPPSRRTWFSTGKGWLALSGLGGEVLPQVEEFKYLGVLFTSEGKMEREIDRRIGAASAGHAGETMSLSWPGNASKPPRRAREEVYGAMDKLCEGIDRTETSQPEAAFIVARDLNNINLWKVLPRYYQHISCPTCGKQMSTMGPEDKDATIFNATFVRPAKFYLSLSRHSYAGQ